MFFVDKKNQKYQFLSHKKLLDIDGDFELVLKFIKKNNKQQYFGENIFFENNFIGNKYNKDKDIIIYDLYRNSNIKIKKGLIKSFSLGKIFDILYYFKIDRIVSIGKMCVYGNFNGFEKNITIDTAKKLFNLGFGKQNISRKNGLYVCDLSFSYGIGEYKHKEDIINSSRGVDKVKKKAYEKSLSEAIERASASYEHKKFVYNNEYKYIYGNFIHREDFEDKKLAGRYLSIKNLNLPKKEKYFSPDEIIYYPVPYNFDSAISNSNGMATHITLKDAQEAGLFELIERDVFLLMRFLKKGIHKISNDETYNAKKILLIEKKYNVKIHSFVIKFDNPIPVTSMLVEKNQKTMIVSGTGINIQDSFDKTIRELVGMMPFLEYEKNDLRDNPVIYHIAYYLESENYDKMKRLIDLPYTNIKILEDIFILKYSFKKILKYYQGIGISLFRYNFKNIINNIYGRYTVRVISNNFIPIYFGTNLPMQIFESSRLNYRKKYFSVTKINFDLQPFG